MTMNITMIVILLIMNDDFDADDADDDFDDELCGGMVYKRNRGYYHFKLQYITIRVWTSKSPRGN